MTRQILEGAQTISDALSWECPCCGDTDGPMRFEDGDTVEHGGSGRTAAHLIWGTCPACAEEVYDLEITQIPPMKDGWHLIDDRYWAYDDHRLMELFALPAQDKPFIWGGYWPGRKVTVQGPDGRKQEIETSYVSTVVINGFCAEDRMAAFRHAQKLLGELGDFLELHK